MPAKSRATPTIIDISYNRGDSLPTVASILCLVTDADAAILQYTWQFANTEVEWLKLSGLESTNLIDLGNPTVYPVLQNLNLLSENYYVADLIFEVTDGSSLLSTFKTSIKLTLTGTPTDLIRTDQTNYDIVYNRATNAISGDSLVTILNNTDEELLDFTNAESIFANVSDLTDAFTISEDPANLLANNSLLPITGTKVIYAQLKKADGTFLNNFTITLSVINASELVVSPESFEFEVQKSLNESNSDILKIVNPLGLDFMVTYPDWLLFPVNSGNSSASLDFSTESSGSLAVGELSGNIIVSYDSKTIEIPVKLTVINFVAIDGYGTYNFCLDDLFLRVFQINEAARSVRIKVNAVFETSEKTLETDFNLNLVYINNKCKINLGEKIHNYFPRNKNCILKEGLNNDFDNKLEYKPAKIIITVEELDDKKVILKTETLSEIKLYPGKKPKLFPLFTNHSARHRVAGSTYIFSYLADLVNTNDFTDDNFPANPFTLGDVQRIKIEDQEELIFFPPIKTILGIDFITFPAANNPITVEWQNQNLAKEWFVFTGEYKFNNDYLQVAQKSSFTSLNEKFDVTKERSIILNTGFILKKESDLIDEIIQSKLVFLKINGKIYQAFAQSTKMVLEDSTLELVQFDLEFYIVKHINGN